jgi:hypothetical protein
MRAMAGVRLQQEMEITKLGHQKELDDLMAAAELAQAEPPLSGSAETRQNTKKKARSFAKLTDAEWDDIASTLEDISKVASLRARPHSQPSASSTAAPKVRRRRG